MNLVDYDDDDDDDDVGLDGTQGDRMQNKTTNTMRRKTSKHNEIASVCVCVLLHITSYIVCVLCVCVPEEKNKKREKTRKFSI